MAENEYSISEAAALVAVETHVLRYWEEELDIKIKRNEMGHRCYEEKDIKILQRVKTLKDKGILLKAIKDIVHKMYEVLEEEENRDVDTDKTEKPEKSEKSEKSEKADKPGKITDEKRSAGKDDKSEQLTALIETIDTVRLRDDDVRIVDFKMAQFQNMMDKIVSNSIKDNLRVISQSVSASVSDDVVKQVDVVMKEQEEREEARYRKLDATIRELQQARQEIAAAEMKTAKRGFFGRKKK